ncbi:MAG: hypothetical protein H6626_11490 [Pseudobdellovibrionaceae bacterium]|nr:hypothetical protein [Bdellovibrionales bacterium]USN46818.1 MAG: hypothetical protein H6626_11490 [Pseudobdellovibrionaceae bacterium]
MFTRILGLLVMLSATTALGALDKPIYDVSVFAKQVQTQMATQALNWKVGDSTDHNLNMGFLPGTMHSEVREETSNGFWIQQDVELGFGQTQKIEVLFDKNTGQVLEVRVNGEKQSPPDAGNMEVVDMKEASVTVPKGTFDCIYVKIRDTKKNEESEAWINPELIPINGLIKTIAPGPFGEVVLELTDYRRM